MIFNRTQNDVDTAISLRAEKVQKFQELTSDEVETLERGTLTINTLNRIESKQEELKNLFNSMGYWNSPIIIKTWNSSQIFKGEEFDRILNNLEMLKEAFFVYKDTPNTPLPVYHYTNINDIEKILYDLDMMIDDIKVRYRQCGTFQCGEVNNQ